MLDFLKKRWVYHSLIWFGAILVSLYPEVLSTSKETILEFLWAESFFLVPLISMVYINWWAKSVLFDQRKYLAYFLFFISLILVFSYLFVYIDNWDTLYLSLVNVTFFLLFSSGLQYFKRGIVNQYQLQELKAKTAETELNALKAQINPHFLFNTLNNIYGMNQIDSQKGSEMIIELADVMRYHLEFSKRGLVKIEDEIQLLESYIKLEKLRLHKNCKISIDFKKVNSDHLISPLIFLPYVENAFKHGTHPSRDCFIDISIKCMNGQIVFITENSQIKGKKVVKTNIGLKNTKRRLDLIYPNKHELIIEESESTYKVKLTINYD